MEKEKLIEFIKENRNLFPEVTNEQIRLFEYSYDYELSLNIDKKIKVTPLIMNISNYALISALLTENEITELEKHLSLEKFNTIKSAIDLSLSYIESTEGNLNHPSISLLNSFISGTLSNEMILNICSDIAEKYDDETISDDLMDFVSEIDNIVDSINCDSFDLILSNIDDFNEIKILDLLYRYVEQRASVAMGITNGYLLNKEKGKPMMFSTTEDLTEQIVNDVIMDQETGNTLGDYIQLYAEIFIKIDKYIDYTLDDELSGLLKILEKKYIEYKYNKNNTIRNINDVSYFYKKCHKM